MRELPIWPLPLVRAGRHRGRGGEEGGVLVRGGEY